MIHMKFQDLFSMKNKNEETQRPQFAHHSKTVTAYLQMPCKNLPVLPQQLEYKFWLCPKKIKAHSKIIIWIK